MTITISSTNGNKRQRDAVLVYLDRVLIAAVFPTSRNPLQYLHDHPGSKYRRELTEKLAPHWITVEKALCAARTGSIDT